MVLYLGALQSVPSSFYEAAEIDGASFFQKLWYITIPNIKTVVELTIFLGINGSVQTFLQPLLVTQGGPGTRTESIVSYTLKVAFTFGNYGLASALGVTVMLVVIILVGVQQFIMKNREE
jgi:multiple sugar transport system permease protein